MMLIRLRFSSEIYIKGEGDKMRKHFTLRISRFLIQIQLKYLAWLWTYHQCEIFDGLWVDPMQVAKSWPRKAKLLINETLILALTKRKQ